MPPSGIKAMRRVQQNKWQPTGWKRSQRYEDGFKMCALWDGVYCVLWQLSGPSSCNHYWR